MEQYRSGHNEADSKSVSLSRPVGSNPTCSAKQKLFAFFGKEFFLLGRISPPVFSPHTPHRHTSSVPAGDILRQAHHIRSL